MSGLYIEAVEYYKYFVSVRHWNSTNSYRGKPMARKAVLIINDAISGSMTKSEYIS